MLTVVVYDKELHDWTIKDTVEHSKQDNYAEFVFTVRRCFDYDGRYTETELDIKSPLLKDALQDVLGDVRGVSLVEDVPSIDPKTVFNYEKELQAWLDVSVEARMEEAKTKKPRRDPLTNVVLPELTLEERKVQKDQMKLLLEYIETDFKTTRAQLYPLLENGTITYELLWAVLKSNTIMYTTCPGSGEPRAFRLEYAQENSSFTRGKWWSVEGRYLEFEGHDDPGKLTEEQKATNSGFGWGTITVDIDSFKGSKKITSLACYPFEMRKDKDDLRQKLIDRGRKFVSLAGQQYKQHNGLAFMKKNRQYLKIHVNGRIMIDPATFRRVNPNYVLGAIQAKTDDDDDSQWFDRSVFDTAAAPAEDDACNDCSGCSGSSSNPTTLTPAASTSPPSTEDKNANKVRWVLDNSGQWQIISKTDQVTQHNKLDLLDHAAGFSDSDVLLASPVVLGWAFAEKLWLEFPVSQVGEIVWNNTAFESLVLPDAQKEIVRALVESHTATSGSNTIDDIITGKGRGLVAVLHGPPGVGKTLTAEGIAELLKRPLYCVSSGELGTSPGQLEHELQRVLDIAQGWGAVLLLDEADVFLEKRSFADMNRNALVSIFLRMLEYFRGILFLTTNRVETFDDVSFSPKQKREGEG